MKEKKGMKNTRDVIKHTHARTHTNNHARTRMRIRTLKKRKKKENRFILLTFYDINE